MGIFSKKTIVCERCGKEFEGRGIISGKLCEDCRAKDEADRRRIEEKRQNVKGYVDYISTISYDKEQYTEEQLDAIPVHREQIVEKYRMTEGISREELHNASDNYKKLTDEQAADVLIRMANSSLTLTAGAAYTGYFFAPTTFEKTIVDAQDVFAVGITRAAGAQQDGKEVIMCVVFTNDPYIPVFPMIYVGKLGFFEIMKSKKGRAGVESMFETLCPNLTYPVQDIKKLKKQIKEEGIVKGNLTEKFMFDQMSNASAGTGLFRMKEICSFISPLTATWLEDYGYLPLDIMNSILKMDKMFNRNYWKKQIKRLADYDIGE